MPVNLPIILFLDDDDRRHQVFKKLALARGYNQTHEIVYVYTARGAIAQLDAHDNIVQAFLDHDLSEDDVMCVVGQPSKVPTGMTVVEHILKMPPKTQPSVIVHSMNTPAATIMVSKLETGGVKAQHVLFHELFARLS